MGVGGRGGGGQLWVIEFVSSQLEGTLTFVDDFF